MMQAYNLIMLGQEKNDLQYMEKLLREGKKQEALPLLAEYLQKNPNSAQGWWLLGLTVSDPKRQIECMERVLRIDPSSVLAQAHLEKLKENESISVQVPPFVESVSFDKPESVSVQRTKQELKPPSAQKTTPASKTNSLLLQYVVIAVLVCVILVVLGFAAITLLRGGVLNQSAQPAEFTQISLPPTWTPQPTATRITNQQLFQASATPVLPILNLNAAPTIPVPRSQVGPSNGYYAPNFSLNNVNNNVTTSLNDYEGQAVIIFFWATWCQYCKAEMPAVQMIYQAYKDKGLTVLAVDVGESASMARSYRDAHFLTFPILDDAGHDVASTYQVTGFPTFFFVDPSGVISSINVGSVGYWGFDKKVKAMLSLP